MPGRKKVQPPEAPADLNTDDSLTVMDPLSFWFPEMQ